MNHGIEDLRPQFREGVDEAEEAARGERRAEAREEILRLDNPLLTAALRYADRGWPVLALWPGAKSPRLRNGVHGATTDESRLLAWWMREPQANIGIATGSVSGLVVDDIDGPEGEETWDWFLDGRPELVTATARSGRLDGGRHLLFALPPEAVGVVPLRGGAGVIGQNVDLLADGQYFVAPPSIHESGRSYCWVRESPVALVPPELMQVLTRNAPRSPSAHGREHFAASLVVPGSTAWGRCALDNLVDELAACPERGGPRGGRDDLANWTYHRVGLLISGGHLTREEVEEPLADALDRNGLGRSVAKLHALEAGIRHGRERPIGPATATDSAVIPEPSSMRDLSVSVSLVPEGHKTEADKAEVIAPPPTPHWPAVEEGSHADVAWTLADRLRAQGFKCKRRFHEVLRDRRTALYLDGHVRCRQRDCEGCNGLALWRRATHIEYEVAAAGGEFVVYIAEIPNGRWPTMARRLRRHDASYHRLPVNPDRSVVFIDRPDPPSAATPLIGRKAFETNLEAAWARVAPGRDHLTSSAGTWKLPTRQHDLELVTRKTSRVPFQNMIAAHGGRTQRKQHWDRSTVPAEAEPALRAALARADERTRIQDASTTVGTGGPRRHIAKRLRDSQRDATAGRHVVITERVR
jgi:hypothetical protein